MNQLNSLNSELILHKTNLILAQEYTSLLILGDFFSKISVFLIVYLCFFFYSASVLN